MADTRPAAHSLAPYAAALLLAAALTAANAPARAAERLAAPGRPISLLPTTPAVAAPAGGTFRHTPEAAPEDAPAGPRLPSGSATLPLSLPPGADRLAAREPASIRHPVSPVLYLPPAPGRPGLTARVVTPRKPLGPNAAEPQGPNAAEPQGPNAAEPQGPNAAEPLR